MFQFCGVFVSLVAVVISPSFLVSFLRVAEHDLAVPRTVREFVHGFPSSLQSIAGPMVMHVIGGHPTETFKEQHFIGINRQC